MFRSGGLNGSARANKQHGRDARFVRERHCRNANACRTYSYSNRYSSPEPTPLPYDYYVDKLDLTAINPDGNYMEPKSLDGIDPFNDKVIALTFDDGPFEDTTPRLLDILQENGINATFFMVGKYVSMYPEIAKRAYEEGNEIGTHSWDHSSNFLTWSHSQSMDQIQRANDAIESATGFRTIFDRPPEGAINKDVAAGFGRMQILWGVDPEDWKEKNRDPEIVYSNVINDENLHDGSIVLSHDIRPTTVDAYDRIIKELKAQGYKFVTVSQLIQIAQLRGSNLSYVFSGSNSANYAAEHGFTAETPGGTPAPSDAATEPSQEGDSSQEIEVSFSMESEEQAEPTAESEGSPDEDASGDA